MIALASAFSSYAQPWCFSKSGATPSIASSASSADSSHTSMGVKQRESAGIGVDHAAVVHLGRRADADDLAAREREPQLARGLVAGVLAEEHVHLVEEEDDAPLGARELRLQLTDALGERAAHAGPGEHRRGLDADEDLVLEARDVVAVRDAHREPAHDARLADARRADEARVVRVALREHVERALDLRLASDHRDRARRARPAA